MTFIITSNCIDVQDRVCVEECPVDCIYEGERMHYIHPDECVDCGACEPVCPVEAIYDAASLPEDLAIFETVNAEAVVGVEGGAQEHGRLAADPQIIAEWQET